MFWACWRLQESLVSLLAAATYLRWCLGGVRDDARALRLVARRFPGTAGADLAYVSVVSMLAMEKGSSSWLPQ